MIGAKLNTSLSANFSQQTAAVIPGGVDSPFRSFQEVGGHTIFFQDASGAYLQDVDGNRYIDYLGAWGPAILGHRPPAVVAAVQNILCCGPALGSPHTLELDLAQKLIAAVPGLEKVRFVNSGTEAVMSAVRLARAYTKRDLLVMFEGCYHGHSDAVLASRTHRASAGIPDSVAANSVLVPFNDLEALRACLKACGRQTAAVLIEPVSGSMGVIPPEPGYLQGVRQLCTEYGALLIFDEVLTGLRVALGGARSLYDVHPDLTCFGKVLGGGLPIGAYGGSQEIMDHLLPVGDVYQAGTFSGNPISMAGGIEVLRMLQEPGVYEGLESRTAELFQGLQEIISTLKLPIQLQRVGSLFSILFCDKPVRNYQDSLSIDVQGFSRFFHGLLSHGIYLPPSAVDAACLSAAHTSRDVQDTIEICRKVLEPN